MISIVETKADLTNVYEDGTPLFDVSGLNPVIAQYKPNIYLAALVGFVLGIIMVCIAIITLSYFSSQKQQTLDICT